MTKKEEKTLLTKVLCEQLPYGVKVAIDFQSYIAWLPDDKDLAYPYRKNLDFILDYDKKTIEDISKEPNIVYSYPCAERFQMLRGYTYQEDYGVPVGFIKPYLRPLSSMTEEEEAKLSNILPCGMSFSYTKKGELIIYTDCEGDNDHYFICFVEVQDFLNTHHFDFRNLIGRGLAIDCTNLNVY